MISLHKKNKNGIPAIFFRFCILIFALNSFMPTSLSAKTGSQSMLQLREIALNFIKNQSQENESIHIKFARWDKRLKLAKCSKNKITAFYPGKQQRLGNVSIGLRCNDQQPWTIYLRLHITKQQNIVHAKRHISRGTIITKNDLVIENIEISNANTPLYHSKKNIIGKVARRSISIGKIITATALKPAIIIKRGQEVIIIAKTSGIIIRTKGKALSDGSIGQVVKVKNSRSKRELQATVIAPNTVKVNM